MEVLGLLLVYQVGWGGYAKFFGWISVIGTGGLVVSGWFGGLTVLRGGYNAGDAPVQFFRGRERGLRRRCGWGRGRCGWG